MKNKNIVAIKPNNLKYISRGDKVDVYLSEGYTILDSTVRQISGQSSDYWVFEDSSGNIYYVKNYVFIKKWSEGGEVESLDLPF